MASNYITDAELKATLSISDTFADADISAACSAASRAIDKITHRRFYPDSDALQVRYYSPANPKRLEIDDLVTFTSLDGDSAGDGTFGDSWTQETDFDLHPLNAAADSEPWTEIIVRPLGTYLMPIGYPRSIKLTGKFGWSVAPDAVVQATTIIAAKLFQRAREAPFGIVGIGAESAAVRIGRYDPDVSLLLGPLTRHRIAVG